MRRRRSEPREHWARLVESQGMFYHSPEGVPYWDESVHYAFTSSEIDELEQATYALDKMCLAAVQHVIDEDRFDAFGIPPAFRDYVRQSWETDERTIYGRFDLAYDGRSPPKLLEYNADTPTSLLEAAVVQWHWLQDVFPRFQQFNSIHERLLEAWQSLRGEVEGTMYFASHAGHVEDFLNVSYLRDVAIQAGLSTAHVHMEDIGWDFRRAAFTDLSENEIRWCFKLYPWEWMMGEQFGPCLLQSRAKWLEPPWKALLSNKALLVVLWELFPESPYLLEASFEPLPSGDYVAKPIHGREGANIRVYEQGLVFLETDGPYDGPVIYQELWPLPRFDQRYFACVGSWMVNGWACGIGIREDERMITGNLSRFVPHLFA